MVFLLVQALSTLLIAACVPVAAFNPKARWLYAAIVFFPLANVYVAGLSLAGVLFALALRSQAAHVELRVLWWFPLLWGVWLTWSVGGYIEHGLTVRQTMQALEFSFYGLVAVLAAAVLKSDGQVLLNTLRACVTSALCLALMCVIAALTQGQWPDGLLGRNESSFVIVVWGIVPAIALLFGLTSRPHSSRQQAFSLVAVAFMLIAIMLVTGRGAMLAALLLLSGALLFALCRKNLGLTLLSGIGVSPVALAMIGLLFVSGILPGISFRLLSFSNMERLGLLVASYDLFLEAPLFGWGFGRIDLLMPFVQETVLSYVHPHNTYARFAVEMGVGGLFFLLLVFGRMFWRAAMAATGGQPTEAFLILSIAGALMTLGMFGVVFYGASRAIPALVAMAFVEALPPVRPMLLTSPPSSVLTASPGLA